MPEHDDQHASQVRQRMLEAAQRLVERAGGLSVNLEKLSYPEIIKEAGVARTSVYREWKSKEDFYVDLLCDLAGPSWQGTAAFDEATIKLARSVVAENLHRLDSEQGRQAVIREAVRRSAKQNFDAVTASSQWRTYVTLTATVLSLDNPAARQRVQEALRSSERFFIQRMANFYADMAIVLGFRLKGAFESYETLAAVGASVVEGLSLRQLLAPDIVDQPITLDGPDGPEKWHLAALGFYGVLEQLIEPNPDYDLAKALPTYLKQLAEREARASAG